MQNKNIVKIVFHHYHIQIDILLFRLKTLPPVEYPRQVDLLFSNQRQRVGKTDVHNLQFAEINKNGIRLEVMVCRCSVASRPARHTMHSCPAPG